MEHFLISVDKHGVRAFRMRERTQRGEEVLFHAVPVEWDELELMRATTPSLSGFLKRFLDALVELGHLVTRMRLEEGLTWFPDEAIAAAAAKEPTYTINTAPKTMTKTATKRQPKPAVAGEQLYPW